MATFQEMNAARAAAVVHRYSSQMYTPFGLESLSNKALSAELSRARSILRKQYERASGQYTNEQAASIQELLRPVKDVPMDERAAVLSEIARQLASGHTTKGGAMSHREEIIKGFQDSNYDFVTNENLNDVLDFVDEFTWKERDRYFGSGVLLKYFNEQKERQDKGEAVKLSRSSFLTWLSKKEERWGTGVSYKEGGKRD